jgi:uncharacterized membrane protein
MTEQGADHWRKLRRKLVRAWFIYLLLSIASGWLFLHNIKTDEPYVFGVLGLIPLLCLRQAWKTDRLIKKIDVEIKQRRITGQAKTV